MKESTEYNKAYQFAQALKKEFKYSRSVIRPFCARLFQWSENKEPELAEFKYKTYSEISVYLDRIIADGEAQQTVTLAMIFTTLKHHADAVSEAKKKCLSVEDILIPKPTESQLNKAKENCHMTDKKELDFFRYEVRASCKIGKPPGGFDKNLINAINRITEGNPSYDSVKKDIETLKKTLNKVYVDKNNTWYYLKETEQYIESQKQYGITSI